MGQPHGSSSVTPTGEEPGEVKHLSTRRKRNRRDPPSSGERKGKSPNQYSNWRIVLEKRAAESESLVDEISIPLSRDPK